MTLERRGIYLLEADDAELVAELARIDARGRKTELLRNYAVLGHQRARKLCSEMEDRDDLCQVLAKLFAPRGMPPDFRAAADFLRVYDAGKRAGQGGGQPTQQAVGAPAAAPEQAARLEAQQESVPSAPNAAKPAPNWGNLAGLIGKNSQGT